MMPITTRKMMQVAETEPTNMSSLLSDWLPRRWRNVPSGDSSTFSAHGYRLSTLPMRGATLLSFASSDVARFQSTLPMRGATGFQRWERETLEFQSTLPMRGATFSLNPPSVPNFDFNPRSPCGERPGGVPAGVASWEISIHAPHAGSDG